MSIQWTCSQCGQTNAETMHFCPACGAASPAVVKPDAGSNTAGPITKPSNRRLLWALAVGLWVAGCAVLAVGGGIWLSRPGIDGPPVAEAEIKPVIVASTPSPSATSILLSPPAVLELDAATPLSAAEDNSIVIDSETLPTNTLVSKIGDKLALPSSTSTATPSATPTSTPTATATPRPAAPPPVAVSACPPGAQITAPAEGTRFTQRYNYVLGIANIPGFHHWRIEYSTNPTGSWNHLFERDYPVDNDKLMMLDAKTVPRGPYGLRLTVVNETGNYPELCEVWFVNAY